MKPSFVPSFATDFGSGGLDSMAQEDGDGGWADFTGPSDPTSSRTSEPDFS